MISYLHWIYPHSRVHASVPATSRPEYADLLWWQQETEYVDGWPCWISPRREA